MRYSIVAVQNCLPEPVWFAAVDCAEVLGFGWHTGAVARLSRNARSQTVMRFCLLQCRWAFKLQLEHEEQMNIRRMRVYSEQAQMVLAFLAVQGSVVSAVAAQWLIEAEFIWDGLWLCVLSSSSVSQHLCLSIFSFVLPTKIFRVNLTTPWVS